MQGCPIINAPLLFLLGNLQLAGQLDWQLATCRAGLVGDILIGGFRLICLVRWNRGLKSMGQIWYLRPGNFYPLSVLIGLMRFNTPHFYCFNERIIVHFDF